MSNSPTIADGSSWRPCKQGICLSDHVLCSLDASLGPPNFSLSLKCLSFRRIILKRDKYPGRVVNFEFDFSYQVGQRMYRVGREMAEKCIVENFLYRNPYHIRTTFRLPLGFVVSKLTIPSGSRSAQDSSACGC
eukprot:2270456-Rhodomonas_salina.2